MSPGDEASSHADETHSGWPQALAGVRALVVDDEADTRELVGEILSRHGAHVDVAPDAASALRLHAMVRYDLLVSDIAMPGMDGHELLRQWLQRGGRRPRRAIALTAFAEPEDRRRAEDVGYDCLLAKPVEPGELIRAALAPRNADTRMSKGRAVPGSGRAALQ
jgi:CheY-like chemotaxis protein